uniref:Transthyretin-like family protein n=1 Tax=Panagrolaimus superbus TaxID=310955 RepID=A0A914Z6X2_9BILA
MNFLLITFFVAAILSFVICDPEYTSFEPADYVFHGRIRCGARRAPILSSAYARLMEFDPISAHDDVQTSRIGKDGNFTVRALKHMTDPPTHQWELFLQFHHPCDFGNGYDQGAIYASGFVKADLSLTGYETVYTIEDKDFFCSKCVSVYGY